MSLPLPNLDDRSFPDLVAEACALIPRHAPEWTNFNPADPGITLLELFAWLTEITLYRLNQIPERNFRAFLELIGVTQREGESIEEAVARALRALRAPTRLVTFEDFEILARRAASVAVTDLRKKIVLSDPSPPRLEDFEVLGVDVATDVARAKAALSEARDGNVNIAVLPSLQYLSRVAPLRDLPRPSSPLDRVAQWQSALSDASIGALNEAIRLNLDPFRPLTTGVAVFSPVFVPVQIEARVFPKAGAAEADLARRVVDSLAGFLDPYIGGEAGDGWPFGRSLHRTELYQRIEAVPGVDYVAELQIDGSAMLEALAIGPQDLLGATSIAAHIGASA
jgi:hypothetical protein